MKEVTISKLLKPSSLMVSVPKRTYLAATTHLPPVPSRLIKKGSSTVSLQTYEQHLRYEDEFPYIRKMLAPLLRLKLFFGASANFWGEKLAIKEGMIIQGYSPLASGSVQLLQNRKLERLAGMALHPLATPQKLDQRYASDLLYTIPQDIWESFVTELPDQEVVQLLNLNKYRHLWLAYNYAVSDLRTEIRKHRAYALGQYHFLIDFIKDTAAGVIDNVLREKILSEIDCGIPPKNILKKVEPFFTEQFFKKFAHSINWEDEVMFIGKKLIMSKVSKFGKISKTKMDSYIGELPSSQKDPATFAKFANDIKCVYPHRLSITETAACLFYHKRKDSGAMMRIDLDTYHLIEDYISALTKDFLLPYCARLLLGKEWLKDASRVQSRLEELKKLCGRIIADATREDTLMHLQERWHRNITLLESRKPEAHFKRGWHCLFKELVLEGTTFKCLTSDDQLRGEGDEMNHCVGGYVDSCMLASSHIVRVESGDGERATLEIYFKDNKATIKQNFGPKNKKISDQMERTCAQLLLKINNGEITLNSERGAISRSIKLGPIESIYPYDINDYAVQERIFQAYKSLELFPSIMVAPSYDAMLRKMGIEEAVLAEKALEYYSYKPR